MCVVLVVGCKVSRFFDKRQWDILLYRLSFVRNTGEKGDRKRAMMKIYIIRAALLVM